jgi:hypothetical protein
MSRMVRLMMVTLLSLTAARCGQRMTEHEPKTASSFAPEIHGERVLRWLDRDGRVLHEVPGSLARWGPYRLTSDDRTLIATIGDGDGAADLWRVNLETGERERLTSDRSDDSHPVIAPSNAEVAWAAARHHPGAIFRRPAIRGGERPWVSHDGAARPTHWTHQWLVSDVLRPDGTSDIWISAIDAAASSRPYLDGPWDERGGRLDPTSQWMVFESSAAGRPEIYVATFPDPQYRWLVSLPEGGQAPMWRRTGLEVFYVAPGGRLMAATIRRGAPYVLPELARTLFVREDLVPALIQTSGDGERFLVAVSE